MCLSHEQIDVIEEMAELFCSPEDIAINVGVDIDVFETQIKAREGECFIAYKTGWLRGDLKIRKSVAKSAENGSNPAQTMLLEMQRKTMILL